MRKDISSEAGQALRKATTRRTMDPAEIQLRREIRPAQQRRLGDEVYEALARLISAGELTSGSRLPAEGELCQLFAVSRPVVRTALARLRDEGLIEPRKGSGWYVLAHAGDGGSGQAQEQFVAILQALEFRRSVEPDAAYFAALRRTADDLDMMHKALKDFEETIEQTQAKAHVDFHFHMSIAKSARNTYYMNALEAIEYDIDLGQMLAHSLSMLGQSARRRAIFNEHEAIFTAIGNQDPAGAKAAMLQHIEHSQLRVIARGQELLRRTQAVQAD
ncbi:FadR/GntR family transcriptional regulator [Jiella avicenniae]|uniref:FadR family transcriptional regulator n=1 Tax=Jiella avicenniae TaxID=2907202 RepID=A0A9X1T6A3_9HYPH|nr:FadR/GntR family transcriptional regulator [Jiella avicenniae]MCE7029679.1 FadR family transcriptional regulator [Jiella avicenniae]